MVSAKFGHKPIWKRVEHMHNILIVDDSFTIRKAAEIALRFEPFALHMAEGKESAESIIAEIDLDAVLIDVGLPKEDSANLCQILHNKFGDRLKILLLSRKDAPLSPGELEELHAIDQIEKPFQTQALIDKTRKSLGLEIEESVATIRFGGVTQAPEALEQAVFSKTESFPVTTSLPPETNELSLADTQQSFEISAPPIAPSTPITAPESLTPKIIYFPPPAAAPDKASNSESTETYRNPYSTTTASNLSNAATHEDLTHFQTEDRAVFGETKEPPAAAQTPIATDLPEEEVKIPVAPPVISVTEHSDQNPLVPQSAITSEIPDDNTDIPPFTAAPILAPNLTPNDARAGDDTTENLVAFTPITDLTNDLLGRDLEPSHDQPLLPELDEEQLMPLVEAAVRKIAMESIESVVWEVVPQICELIIRERLSEINPGLDALR